MSSRLGLTGDVMLGRLVDQRQARRAPEAVWGDMLDRLNQLDALVINLECCVAAGGRQWERTDRPFHFRADPVWAVPALQRAGVDAACLANNHILDFEVPALLETLDRLERAEIATAGAGADPWAARRPAIVDCPGLRIGMVAFTDNTPEYSASVTRPGTARIEMDPSRPETRAAVTTALNRLRLAQPDLVIASLHWGPNMVTEPPPRFRRFGRWLIDQGADVVHGHSAHVFQGIETYRNRPILYDTGDFVDDYAVDSELRNDRSFLFELVVTPDGSPARLELRPVAIDDCTVHAATDDAAAWSRERLRERSATYGTTFSQAGERLMLHLAE